MDVHGRATGDHVLVMAKEPVAGKVKTRLCPPCTPQQAADIAAAALADVLDAVAASGAARRVLALDGQSGPWLPSGFEVIAQHGATFNERLTHAWRSVGGPGLQVGMDTPQVTGADIDEALDALHAPGVDAVLGPALDGGWWAIGLHEPHPDLFTDIAMSCDDTYRQQERRLEALGLQFVSLAWQRDLDHFDDAIAISTDAPSSRTAREVRSVLDSDTTVGVLR